MASRLASPSLIWIVASIHYATTPDGQIKSMAGLYQQVILRLFHDVFMTWGYVSFQFIIDGDVMVMTRKEPVGVVGTK